MKNLLSKNIMAAGILAGTMVLAVGATSALASSSTQDTTPKIEEGIVKVDFNTGVAKHSLDNGTTWTQLEFDMEKVLSNEVNHENLVFEIDETGAVSVFEGNIGIDDADVIAIAFDGRIVLKDKVNHENLVFEMDETGAVKVFEGNIDINDEDKVFTFKK